MVTISAQNSLDDNNLTTTDISLVVAERIIDKAISYFNLKTGRTITFMAGVEESKTTTCDEDEYGVLEAIITCMFREAVKTKLSNSDSTSSSTGTSSSIGVGSISVSQSSSVSSAISAAAAINNPANTIYHDFIIEGLRELRVTSVAFRLGVGT